MNPKELSALISLLDDTDREVLAHVEQKIVSLGEGIIPLLETQWEQQFDPNVQRRIEELIHSLQLEGLTRRLLQWKDEGALDLMEGMWLVNTYQYPDVDRGVLEKHLAPILSEAKQEVDRTAAPLEQVKQLNRVLYERFKFAANTKNFHSPANSMLGAVLESKRGNPISLCVVYLMVARHLEMPVYGVNLPNLFVLTYRQDGTQFYVNAFNKGLIFSKTDIDSYISHLNLEKLPTFYEPCSNLEIIHRVLRNLIVSFERIGETDRVEEIQGLLTALS